MKVPWTAISAMLHNKEVKVVVVDAATSATEWTAVATYIDARMSALDATMNAAAHHALMYGDGSTMPPNYIIEEPEPKEPVYEQPIPSWLKFATRKADRQRWEAERRRMVVKGRNWKAKRLKHRKPIKRWRS